MPFLSRRSVDPLITSPSTRDKQSDHPRASRSRARSDATLFRRVSTLFAGRRRTPPKESASPAKPRPPALGHICHTLPRSALPRASNDSTPQVSLEIRRPSGLGRRASLMGSDDSFADSDSVGREVHGRGDRVPKGYASLPNLLGGTFYLPGRPSSYHGLMPTRSTASAFPLPDSLLRVVLESLPRHDLPVAALVSRGFCMAARCALYHSLDVQAMAESSLERLYNVLACNKALAALVASFCASSWSSLELVSPDGCVSSIPSDDVRQAFYNMYNLKSLTLYSIESILSHTSSLPFSLTHLTILDTKITQSQLQTIRNWLATQPSLESLSFPHLVEYTNVDPSLVGEWATATDSLPNDRNPFTALLPALKSLHAPTDIVSALCFTMANPIQHLKLDVRDTLYTGLRPSAVIGSLDGVREMHIIFAAGVDKRTVEKFLVITGNMLTGENKIDAMKSLEVEVLWTDHDAAEILYGIVTSIISRFRGLETLKLTAPFRSVQPVVPDPVYLPLIGSHSPAPSLLWTPNSSSFPWTCSPRGSMILKEFVPCDVEKNYARTWTKHCPSLSDIQFDFSCSTTNTEMDMDVELCGILFRRKVPSSFP